MSVGDKMEKYNVHFKKKFGQNFLRDTNIVKKIVNTTIDAGKIMVATGDVTLEMKNAAFTAYAGRLMKRLLADCDNNLNTLGKKTLRELCAYNGIGEAKAVSLLAACELGKRRAMEKAQQRPCMDNAVSIYNYMHPRMQDLYQEEAWALLLNQHLRLIKAVRISQGGITETAIDVRVVMREALLANATVVALCHNHPSGNIKPSRQDDGVAERVRKACETMRLHLLDHVIVTDGAYYSYQEQGRL